MKRRSRAKPFDEANEEMTWLCEGLMLKDLIAPPTFTSLTAEIERLGLTKRAASKIARSVLQSAPTNKTDNTSWEEFQTFLDTNIHRDENGKPTGWGLTWKHLQLMYRSAAVALQRRRAPTTPGTHAKTEDGWKLVSEHSWRIRLIGIDETADEHVAAGILSGVNNAFRLMRDPGDSGDLIHTIFHLAELNYELALRLSGFRQFVEIGFSVAEKGALENGVSQAEARGEKFWAAYEAQFKGAPSAYLRPNAFAKEHWKEFGYPSASAAQRFLSRRNAQLG